MTTPFLRGVFAAIATPISNDGAPDATRFVALAQYLLDNGCDGLNVLGTTGEATSFTVRQRMDLMTAAAQAGLPLDRLMVGTGASAVGDAVELTCHAAALGYAAALVLPPFYYKNVPDEGVVRYIDALAAGTGTLPILLYNFPALSGVAYTEGLVARLIDVFGDRIAGLKDSSGDLAYASRIAALNPGLSVFPSNEAVLLDARGGAFAGCISATANLNADLCGRAFHAGDAQALADAVAIRELFTGRALVPGVKAVLAHIHGDKSLAVVAPPLAATSAEEASELSAGYERIRQKQ